MSDWSSFEYDKDIMEAWRSYLSENEDIDEGFFGDMGRKVARWGAGEKIKKMVGRGYGTFGDDDEETPAPAPAPGGAPEADPGEAPDAAPAPSGGGGGENALDVPGTELATMGVFLDPANPGGPMGPKLAKKINQILLQTFGASVNKPEFKPHFSAFRKHLIPALMQIDKKAHIDVGESIGRHVVITEAEFASLFLLNEEIGQRQKKKDRQSKVGHYGEKDATRHADMTNRQRGYKKGRMRGKTVKYAKGLITPKKNGISLIARKIVKLLQRDYLANEKNVNIDALAQIAQQVGSKIKDPKDQKWYLKNYANQIAKQPEKRLAVYKQNVDMLMNYLLKAISAAGAQAISDVDTVGTVDVADPTMEETINKKQLGQILSEELSRALNEKRRIKTTNKAPGKRVHSRSSS